MLLVGTLLAAIPVFKKAWIGVRNRQLNAELLVSFAVVAAMSIGEFFAAGEVAFIMFVGEHLEEFTIHRAKRSIGNLLGQVPKSARILRSGEEVEVLIGSVKPGDVALVRPGEQIPVDGTILKGEAAINESMITGESMPADKGPGAEVFAGTLNTNGALQITATRVGHDSTLEQIATLVEEAKSRQAPIQRACDKYARFVIPLMLALSLLTYLVTHDFYRAIVVMIVACPCALVVATPTAVVAGIARAAREGVLIKGGAYLETAGCVDTVVFDKTGTLTEGRLLISKVETVSDVTVEMLVRAAAVAEKFSEHPLGKAVLEYARKTGVALRDPEDFRSFQGAGVTALVDGLPVIVGKREFLKSQGIDLSQAPFQAEGGTELWVGRAGKLIGRLHVTDKLRDQSLETMRSLRACGIRRIILLSGDRKETAERLADELGIPEVIAEVLPAQKAEVIRKLREGGARVAMVGEGVNDAPALATADIGMAMGLSGSDVAHEAAQIALMSDDLSKISYAIRLSRKTLTVIKQGLWFAVVFNLVMISTAMVNGLDDLAHLMLPIHDERMGMVLAAIAHQSSSTLVILNSMRLLGFRDQR
jgi:heavy metal translocating P-type ATPase